MRGLALFLFLAATPVLAEAAPGPVLAQAPPAPGPMAVSPGTDAPADPIAPATPVSAPAPLPWSELAARQTLAAVKASSAEGLAPTDYGLVRLETALAGTDQAEVAAAAEAGWMALATAYAAGRTPVGARRGWKGPMPRSDPDWLRAKLADGLAAGAPAEALAALLPTHPAYAALKGGLARATTPVERNRLRANLDRWRWLPRQLGERYLLANVPAYEVDLWDGGQLSARHKMIVGKPDQPTPQFSAAATAVTMNPPWLIPQSIIAESVGGLIRRSPRAARARGYSWKSGADGKLYVTQAPGANNSLGKMKIEMPNAHAIFFHDTPAKTLFAKDVRALSHGCMRTQGIFGLGLRLLEDQPEWDGAAIDATVAAGKTVTVPLIAQMPVHIGYFTVAPGPGGTLRVFPDIYGLDEGVVAALGG
ncbi:MAG: L,D-transpeptidase family protein [Sandaracinobacteroides sp.]